MNVLREAFDLLKDIPAGDFIVGEYYNKTTKKSCALGWYVRKKYSYLKPKNITDLQYMELSQVLRNASIIQGGPNSGADIADINNYPLVGFVDVVIKERVMACFSHFNIN